MVQRDPVCHDRFLAAGPGKRMSNEGGSVSCAQVKHVNMFSATPGKYTFLTLSSSLTRPSG